MQPTEMSTDVKKMTDITWRAPIFGAVILVTIGSVLAVMLGHSGGALKSIKARLGGRYKCQISHTFNSTRLCNDSEGFEPVRRDCVYVYVNYTDKRSGVQTSPIKLALTYFKEFHENDDNVNMTRSDIFEHWERGKCSADYCGEYRYKKFNHTGPYKVDPPLIQTVQEAIEEKDSNIDCFINTLNPSAGAYLYLNYDLEDNIKDRMFRYYEGWIILVIPPTLALVIFIALIVMFVRGDLSASPVQRKIETFVSPGAAPASPVKSDKSSSHGGSQVSLNHATTSHGSASNGSTTHSSQQSKGSTEKLVSINNNHV